jgi:hypothetical protein
MISEKLTNYYNLLEQWMTYYGFSPITVHADAGIDRVYKRSRFEATKFGTVDAYCCAKFFENPDGGILMEFSSKMFDMASRHRTGSALGFGAMLVVYPLIVTENISQEIYKKIRQYCPKHFAATEFPVVIDLATGFVYYYEQTPLWGSAYYAGFRKQAYEFFSPKSWEAVSKTAAQPKTV